MTVRARSEEAAIQQVMDTYGVSPDDVHIESGEPDSAIRAPYISVRFKPQQVRDDRIYPAHAKGNAQWKVPFGVAVLKNGQLPESRCRDSDRLAMDTYAPLWVREHTDSHPFEVVIDTVVLPEEFESGSLEETASDFFENHPESRLSPDDSALSWEDCIPQTAEVDIE